METKYVAEVVDGTIACQSRECVPFRFKGYYQTCRPNDACERHGMRAYVGSHIHDGLTWLDDLSEQGYFALGVFTVILE
jgi:hypothetical protein